MFIFGCAVDRSAFSPGIDNTASSKCASKSAKSRHDSSATNKPRTATQSTTCCNCFGTLKMQRKESTSDQMSEVYCRMCDDYVDSPACLINVTAKADTDRNGCRPKHKTILTVESELEMTQSKVSSSPKKSPSKPEIATSRCTDECSHSSETKNSVNGATPKSECKMENETNAMSEEYELADDAIVCDDNASEANHEARMVRDNVRDEMIRVQGKEELPVTPEEQIQCNIFDNYSESSSSSVEHLCETNPSKQPYASHSNETDPNNGTNLLNDDISHGNNDKNEAQCAGKSLAKKVNCTDNHPLLVANGSVDGNADDTKPAFVPNGHGDLNGNDSIRILRHMHRIYSTLPKAKRTPSLQQMINQNERLLKSVPTRITPDGTTIYYWCDLPKQTIEG